MEGLKTEVSNFIARCEEMKNCKFIMATTKIKDILKAIVNSQVLYELFTSFSSAYNYTEGKRRCLKKSYDGISYRGCIELPENDGERLAFIFCLLVDLDRDAINFNDFLQEYFSDDGSYYASYRTFCETIIDDLECTVKKLFEEELGDIGGVVQTDIPADISTGHIAKLLSTISLLIAQEKQFIQDSSIPKEDKETAFKMLTEIFNCLKEQRITTANAVVCGYNYYILYNNSISPNVQTLFEKIEEYESLL